MAIIFDQEGTPITSANPFPTQLSGSTLAEDTQDQDDAVSNDHTFSEEVEYIEIANRDTSNDLVATVNGRTIIVPPEVVYGPVKVSGTASATVTVTGSTSYLLNRYE